MRTIELQKYPRSYSNIEVLPFLNGRKIDKVVMGYLHALRPSIIEVVPFKTGTHMDCHQWRVRIFLNENEKIEYIEQEVEVGCYDGIDNGHQLSCELRGIKYKKSGCVILDPNAIVKVTIV